MRWSSSPAAALLCAGLLGCSGAPPRANAAAPGDAEALAFTEAHNRARAAADPPAEPPLQPLRWSDALASHAAQVAARCEFEHSQGAYGENIAARKTAAGPAATAPARSSATLRALRHRTGTDPVRDASYRSGPPASPHARARPAPGTSRTSAGRWRARGETGCRRDKGCARRRLKRSCRRHCACASRRRRVAS